VNDELVARLADALGVPLSPERRAAAAESLAAQVAAGGGAAPEELDGVEPAVRFEPEPRT